MFWLRYKKIIYEISSIPPLIWSYEFTVFCDCIYFDQTLRPTNKNLYLPKLIDAQFMAIHKLCTLFFFIQMYTDFTGAYLEKFKKK